MQEACFKLRLMMVYKDLSFPLVLFWITRFAFNNAVLHSVNRRFLYRENGKHIALEVRSCKFQIIQC